MRGEAQAIPVTLLTGFLGSGKTTLVNHLLAEDHGRRLAVVVNEFGALGIDAALILGAAGAVVELPNGCLCCATRGDLSRALQELLSAASDLDGILIETSGLADPEPVIMDLEMIDFGHALRLDGVITVIDAANFDRNLDSAEAAFQQINQGDVLLINKTDLVEPGIAVLIAANLGKLNPKARILPCTSCAVPLDIVLGPLRVDRQGARTDGTHQAGPAHHHDTSHHAHGGFETAVLRVDRPLRPDRLCDWIDALPVSVFRAKGFVRLAGTHCSTVVHVVGGRRWFAPSAEPWPEAGSVLVVIGRDLSPAALQAGLIGCAA